MTYPTAAPQARMTGGDALAAQLVREGIHHVFGVPGVQLDYAIDGLARLSDDITYWNTRHEQATSYMADGFARATGQIGACMVVPGPGLLNALSGVATAYACSSRVLCLAGQVPSTAIGRGLGQLHEIPEQSAILAALTKWSACARTPQDVPVLVHAAVRQLRTGRPRPVGLEIPPDILQAEADIAQFTQVGYLSQAAFPVYHPRTYIAPGYQGTLGYGFPTALGAKIGVADRPVLSISGDGGFGWALSELSTARKYDIGLVTVVFNDQAYGNVRRSQMEQFGGRLLGTDLVNPDFVRLAESFGVRGARATTPAELQGLLLETLSASTEPVLIDVPVGAMPNPRRMRESPLPTNVR